MIDQAASIPQRRPLNWLLYILARQYIDSAKILEDRVLETKNADPAPAIIMCLSFSIELILKCLLIVDKDEVRTRKDMEEAGIDPRGHDYLVSFCPLGRSLFAKTDAGRTYRRKVRYQNPTRTRRIMRPIGENAAKLPSFSP
jgi:hypothetical protein